MVEQNTIDIIYHDIRNMRTLTQEQINIIEELPHSEKMKIIKLLNESMFYLSNLLLDSIDDTSNLTLHTRK